MDLAVQQPKTAKSTQDILADVFSKLPSELHKVLHLVCSRLRLEVNAIAQQGICCITDDAPGVMAAATFHSKMPALRRIKLVFDSSVSSQAAVSGLKTYFAHFTALAAVREVSITAPAELPLSLQHFKTFPSATQLNLSFTRI